MDQCHSQRPQRLISLVEVVCRERPAKKGPGHQNTNSYSISKVHLSKPGLLLLDLSLQVLLRCNDLNTETLFHLLILSMELGFCALDLGHLKSSMYCIQNGDSSTSFLPLVSATCPALQSHATRTMLRFLVMQQQQHTFKSL